MGTMQALWLENQTVTWRNDVPLPSPPGGEALVRVRLAGVCATDLELVRGYYPFTGILGHEFVGEVVEAAGTPDWVGRRVVGEINAACGECEACRAGRPTHCERRTVLGIIQREGVFAEYLSLPVANLHQVPASIPDEAAVFTEPLAAALEIQEQVPIHPSERVLVIGAGRLGQLVAQTLALTGCELKVVARHPHQKKLLGERGIHTLSEGDILDKKMDIVVEATGSEAGFHLARRAVRPRGVLVLKSTYKGEVQVNFSALVVDEITVVGSRCGPFPPALRLLEQQQVDPTPLIETCYPLREGQLAIEHAARPGAMKVLIKP
jgi:threonine dehydrogenase-like Zn-dependent dehydrogenase